MFSAFVNSQNRGSCIYYILSIFANAALSIISELRRIVQSSRRFPLREFTVMFCSVREIAAFVNTVNKYPFRAWLAYGTAQLDAKSLLSLCCLNLNTPLKLCVQDSHADLTMFERDLKPFLVEAAPV